MKEVYVITTDNNADLPDRFYEEHGVGCTWLQLYCGGDSITPTGNFMPVGDFYEKNAGGFHADYCAGEPRLRQEHLFEPYLKEGRDILHIAFSSGRSAELTTAAGLRQRN